VLAVTGAGGPRIAALNEAAEAAGLALGESLADARAKIGQIKNGQIKNGQVKISQVKISQVKISQVKISQVKISQVQTRAIDPAADDAALRRLALWATRYTPTASPWEEENGADGFFLDITGAAHLFGGEERLLADLFCRLERNFGLPARLAIADTAGMAWALARFATPASFLRRETGEDKDWVILPSGGEAQALAPLPVEALRLSPDTCRTLRRLGFKTIGTLLDKPRAPFAARFPTELLRRIDQALGRIEEPLVPVVAPPVYHTLRYLLEPLFTQEAVVGLTGRLMHMLAQLLARDDVGARALRLSLYRVDGAVETIDITLTLPTRNVAHIVRLIDLKLEALAAAEDAGFGFEAIGFAVTRAETIVARQDELIAGGDAGHAESCARLVDKLRQRLGPHSVRSFAPVASHLPERAEILQPLSISSSPASMDMTSAFAEPEQKPRPLLILPRAEPTEVMALIPDGPPRRFCWRGVTYEVAGSEGPERIASEWWRQSNGHRAPGPTRDYYLVEDSGGHRFWLYREGLYGRETTAARWFVQGLFA
jgi:protein ImuB